MSISSKHSAPDSTLTLDPSPAYQGSFLVQHILMAEVIGNYKIQENKTKQNKRKTWGEMKEEYNKIPLQKYLNAKNFQGQVAHSSSN